MHRLDNTVAQAMSLYSCNVIVVSTNADDEMLCIRTQQINPFIRQRARRRLFVFGIAQVSLLA